MNRALVRIGAVVLAIGAMGRAAPAETPRIGLLLGRGPAEQLTAESHAVCELARRLVAAQPLWPTGSGAFVDANRRPVPLDRFAAIWCHQGDRAEPGGPIGEEKALSALRRYVCDGHGLLLSGAAAGLVGRLGAGDVRTRPLRFGHDRGQAGLVPVRPEHPALRDLDLERGVLWMSNAVFPAFSQFRPAAGASRGVLLARTPGGPDSPLMEYSLGKGKLIALPWRLSPHYHIAPGTFRANFERLSLNVLKYLAGGRRPPRPAGKPVGISANEWRALAMAIDDLVATFGDRYPRGADYRRRLAAIRESHDRLVASEAPKAAVAKVAAEFRRLRCRALLANPLLDFERLLLVKRRADKLGLPMNYQGNSSLEPTGYDNEIAVLSPVRGEGRLTTLFRPAGGRFVGDVDLHFDADRLLFSMPTSGGRWGVFEIRADGSHLRRLPLINEPDVDNYDACYLPDGRVIFSSTAVFTGVPCVRGSAHVANLFLLANDGRIRQLTVEQDHDWCPTVLPNGRVMYLRWEYADIPHAFSRILFHMNPDGTGQMAYYGSNSYWPASMFHARPIPGRPGKFVAIVGGHHDLPRMGDLVIFDAGKATFEADGAVQRIPGWGRKVEPALLDLPIAQSWPKFLHPCPLTAPSTSLGAGKYFLVSCKPAADAPWGVYLADVFDNLVLIHQQPGYAMLEPIPLRKTPRPPVIPDRVDLSRRDAEVHLIDAYTGPGLKGVPRGTIKALRLVSYHFAYQGMGGEPDAIGLDGPWDVRQVLGTVPVHKDGSARFRVPAYTPIAVQPLDAEGKAVQVMRSWFTAMPGEVLSCAGCHEPQGAAPAVRHTVAMGLPAAEIRPWYGPARGFDFRREVQPTLDRYCVGCHHGRPRPDGRTLPDLTDRDPVPTLANKHPYNLAARFTPSYYELRKRVRTPTRESDLHLLGPWEFHADTTRLVQMLAKGHHNVRLDAEARDRLVTWIDMNAPAHGTWTTICGAARVRGQWRRRREMRKRYTGMEDDPEAVAASPRPPVKPVIPKPPQAKPQPLPSCPGWPFEAAEARRRQQACGGPTILTVPLTRRIALDLVRIPAGRFVMGSGDGQADERPPCRVRIAAPFWLGRCEVTNEQFALFDPAHDSGLEHGDYIQFSPGERGWTLSGPKQPVVRVSWRQAVAFCRWLSARTGRSFSLPTEAQWEHACRAGTATTHWYGTRDSDFSSFANVSDATHQAIDPFGWSGRTQVIPPWRPADGRFSDHSRVSAPVGTYKPNPWGLCDMHGNVAEWTLSAYRAYPYREDDGRNETAAKARRVVRGGSWYDRPDRCGSAFRQSYLPDQGVYDVGFRVVCSGDAPLPGPGGPDEPPRYKFPPVGKLPDREGMRDPFVMHDGSRVATRKDWARQRHYLKAMLAHYQYGHMPPRPKKLNVKRTSSREVYDGKATEIRLTVTISRGPGSVSLRVGLIRPAGAGPFPVVIKNDRGLFDRPKDKRALRSFLTERAAVGEAVGRGYVICKYIRTDLAADERGKRSQGVFPLYPEYDWGVIAAWAWGYQIVIDALEPLGFADMGKIVVTGHSRGGKTALCGAIYDERIAIAAPNSSGTGGTGSLRYFEKGRRPQTIAAHVGRHDHWWTPRFLRFADREAKLPFDAHFAKALIAPRGLVNPHALQDYWANPYGTQLTHQAAKVVFDWLGVGNHIGIHWRPGGHAQGEEDWRALIDFADRYFFKKDVQRKFDVLPYPDAKVPMTWEAP